MYYSAHNSPGEIGIDMSMNTNKDLETILPKQTMDAGKPSKVYTVVITPDGHQFTYSDNYMKNLGFKTIGEMRKAGYNVY